VPSARRRKAIGLALSGIFPGLGQFYNRQPIKGAAFVVAGAVLSWLIGRAVPGDPTILISTPPGTDVVIPLLLLLAIWVWCLVDAWVVAGR
jgi:hypothetical protein